MLPLRRSSGPPPACRGAQPAPQRRAIELDAIISQANAYFGQLVRNNPVPLNDLINTAGDGAMFFTTWTLKAYGTYEMPGGIRLTPLLRHQSGQPFGRTFVTGLNYGTVRIPAEPIHTRRMDHIAILDLHVEKGFRVPGSGRASAFVDVFNVLNANPEEGTSLRRASHGWAGSWSGESQ